MIGQAKIKNLIDGYKTFGFKRTILCFNSSSAKKKEVHQDKDKL
jgi:hypothetical protein